jgi:hypothetical protein
VERLDPIDRAGAAAAKQAQREPERAGLDQRQAAPDRRALLSVVEQFEQAMDHALVRPGFSVALGHRRDRLIIIRDARHARRRHDLDLRQWAVAARTGGRVEPPRVGDFHRRVVVGAIAEATPGATLLGLGLSQQLDLEPQPSAAAGGGEPLTPCLKAEGHPCAAGNGWLLSGPPAHTAQAAPAADDRPQRRIDRRHVVWARRLILEPEAGRDRAGGW